MFEATEIAERPHGLAAGLVRVRHAILGATISSTRAAEERLTKAKALAVFSSDALSSVAYATQEIIIILLLAGTVALHYSLWIGTAIVALLALVIASYRQTVRAYPGGGGAYIVAHENLGLAPGLIAAASLLVDYVLTVAVSLSAGMDALASTWEGARPFAAPMAVGFVVLIALVNLRGVRESGTAFAIPTYGFVVLTAVTLAVAIGKLAADGDLSFSAGEPQEEVRAVQGVSLFLILRAFSSGCAALTGVEAISNGVQAFQPPESRNASRTLLAMGLMLGSLFFGITFVAWHTGIVPDHNSTVISIIGEQAWGRGPIFVMVNLFTAAILILAANTAFADFPRLSAVLARDGYLPRFLAQRGDRLVFTIGVMALTLFAALLLVAFNATTTRLIPLYALGVFLSFTLSQAGMVIHWRRERMPFLRPALLINAVGAIVTGIVFVVVLITKFTGGAWAVVLLVPLIALGTWRIGRFYQRLGRALRVPPEAHFDLRPDPSAEVRPAIVPVGEVNMAAVLALDFACHRSRTVTAVYVHFDPDRPSITREQWSRQFPHIPLVVIESPYRAVYGPLMWYLSDRLRQSRDGITVVVPNLVSRHRYHRPLLNQSLARIQKLVHGNPRIQVAEYSFRVD